MAVPADIRAVPRPKNTIVDDSGREGPKRYAVRERSSTKYVAGGNPQPRNGKVIGHIIDYEYEYQYCLNISFNDKGEAGRGSAIFLHCIGKAKPYTGGCVAIPEYIMRLVMQHVTEDCVVVIDTFDNMGGSF